MTRRLKWHLCCLRRSYSLWPMTPTLKNIIHIQRALQELLKSDTIKDIFFLSLNFASTSNNLQCPYNAAKLNATRSWEMQSLFSLSLLELKHNWCRSSAQWIVKSASTLKLEAQSGIIERLLPMGLWTNIRPSHSLLLWKGKKNISH